jgi:hypothetical protein
MKISSIQFSRVDTVLELERFCILSNTLDLTYPMLLEICQSVGAKQQWDLP